MNLTKVRHDIDSAKMTTPSSGFGDILGLGSTGAYGDSQNNHGLDIANLENEVNALNNKIGCLEQGADQNEEPKDGRVKFAGLEFRDMDDAVAFVAQNASKAAISAANRADDVTKKLSQLQRDHDKRLKGGNL